MDEAVGT